jgi:hypothetical protein
MDLTGLKTIRMTDKNYDLALKIIFKMISFFFSTKMKKYMD